MTKLHNEGIDIIIALGHSGYERDLEIARLVFTNLFKRLRGWCLLTCLRDLGISSFKQMSFRVFI